MGTHVAVAIVGYNNIGDIQECIGALAKSTYPDFEVVICENGSDHSYRALQDVSARFTRRGPARKSSSNRRPITATQAESISASLHRHPLTLGGCSIPTRSQRLAPLLPWWASRAGRCSGSWRHIVFSRWPRSVTWLHMEKLASPEPFRSARQHTRDVPDASTIERSQTYLSGASMLVAVSSLQRAGSMSEDFFLYCEEVDWCLTAAQKGLRLGFAPEGKGSAQTRDKHGTGLCLSKLVRTFPYISTSATRSSDTRIHFPFAISDCERRCAAVAGAAISSQEAPYASFSMAFLAGSPVCSGRRGIPKLKSQLGEAKFASCLAPTRQSRSMLRRAYVPSAISRPQTATTDRPLSRPRKNESGERRRMLLSTNRPTRTISADKGLTSFGTASHAGRPKDLPNGTRHSTGAKRQPRAQGNQTDPRRHSVSADRVPCLTCAHKTRQRPLQWRKLTSVTPTRTRCPSIAFMPA